jgi:crotonobetainyl-CoA:carnitine CoA-transferase CaiB-like acyl-CoA transferase
MDEGSVAAARRFPDRRRAVEALAAADESFRGLCADFAEAQAALQRWRASASAAREKRCAEYEELVESLADEIATHLDAAGASPSDATQP